MSTRCQIAFQSSPEAAPDAIIYRHGDGYPDTDFGVLADLNRFFEAVEAQCSDRRFDDPEYLAAKYVVWDALGQPSRAEGKPLAFTSLGISTGRHGDISYFYRVICRTPTERPGVSVEKVK
jgi:hypothetical protein